MAKNRKFPPIFVKVSYTELQENIFNGLSPDSTSKTEMDWTASIL
jgi:hypothetical protein